MIMQKCFPLLFEKVKSSQKNTLGLLFINKRVDVHTGTNRGKQQDITFVNMMVGDLIFKYHVVKCWYSGY